MMIEQSQQTTFPLQNFGKLTTHCPLCSTTHFHLKMVSIAGCFSTLILLPLYREEMLWDFEEINDCQTTLIRFT